MSDARDVDAATPPDAGATAVGGSEGLGGPDRLPPGMPPVAPAAETDAGMPPQLLPRIDQGTADAPAQPEAAAAVSAGAPPPLPAMATGAAAPPPPSPAPPPPLSGGPVSPSLPSEVGSTVPPLESVGPGVAPPAPPGLEPPASSPREEPSPGAEDVHVAEPVPAEPEDTSGMDEVGAGEAPIEVHAGPSVPPPLDPPPALAIPLGEAPAAPPSGEPTAPPTGAAMTPTTPPSEAPPAVPPSAILPATGLLAQAGDVPSPPGDIPPSPAEVPPPPPAEGIPPAMAAPEASVSLDAGVPPAPPAEAADGVPPTDEATAPEDAEPKEEEPTFGVQDLLKTLFAPNTLPHFLVLLGGAISLYWFAGTEDDDNLVFAAYGFISLMIGYALTALLSRMDGIDRIVRLQKSVRIMVDADGNPAKTGPVEVILRTILKWIRIWLLPLGLAGGTYAGMLYLFAPDTGPAGDVRDTVPLVLAGLFIGWSIGQGISFTSAMDNTSRAAQDKFRHETAEKPTKKGGEPLDDEALAAAMVRRPKVVGSIIGQMLLVFLLGFILSGIFLSGSFTALVDVINEASAGETGAFFGILSTGLAYIGIVLVLQLAVLLWSRKWLVQAGYRKHAAKHAFRVGLLIQAFAAWHALSVCRAQPFCGGDAGVAVGQIEETFLMSLTVVLAIWMLSSKGVKKGSWFFTPNTALFWGLAFGFGYAGSIAMIANLDALDWAAQFAGGDGIKGVLALGHVIVLLTLYVVHRAAIRNYVVDERIATTACEPLTPEGIADKQAAAAAAAARQAAQQRGAAAAPASPAAAAPAAEAALAAVPSEAPVAALSAVPPASAAAPGAGDAAPIDVD